ncbi:hypothetical protein K438DRAFT_1639597, partial [Mycena galopus ATCC 62051]
EEPCPVTGMWIIKPDLTRGQPGEREWRWYTFDSLLRGAHPIGVAGKEFVPAADFGFRDSLDAFLC